jgi:hypothetical protein
MDGNGRWAQRRGLPRTAGHTEGEENLAAVVRASVSRQVDYLTVFGFSTENWVRPRGEVRHILGLHKKLFGRISELNDLNVRVQEHHEFFLYIFEGRIITTRKSFIGGIPNDFNRRVLRCCPINRPICRSIVCQVNNDIGISRSANKGQELFKIVFAIPVEDNNRKFGMRIR